MLVPLKIELFGPMQVWVDGQSMGTVRSRKAHWLLALLTLRNGRPASREWIASRLWPDSEDAVALSNLRPILSELRQSLRSQAFRLESPSRSTLVLNLEDAEVDALKFDAAIDAKDFELAISLHTGPLLDGCPEEWAQQDRRQREEACAHAYEALAAAASKDQQYNRAIDLYRDLIELEPWRDSARRGLMQALASVGDTNEALQAYREFASYLSGDSGAIPDEQTTSLYLDLRSSLRDGPKKAPTYSSKVVGNLPAPITSLVGLEDERLDVCNRLRQHRMVTLTGFGGIGKTRLAREVALSVSREFPDGVSLVALDSVQDDRLTLHKVLLALGLTGSDTKSALTSLCDHFREQRALLVLDNCEHLLSECAQICETLLRECSRLHILATSREPLAISGEKVWHTTPLSAPDPTHLPGHPATLVRVVGSFDSVQLFVDRAKAVKDDFELNIDNAQRVAEVCHKLEGIPLAIELAAASVKSMTIHQIASRVQEPVSFLSQGSRSNTARHQTMRATIDWSYAFLSDDERALLSQVALFVGGWTLEAAESICNLQTGHVAATLSSLVDKSLVVFEPSGRYRLLETVREYSLAQQDQDNQVLRRSFVEYFSRLIKQLVPDASALQNSLVELGLEEANIRQALNWAREDSSLGQFGLSMAATWSGYWFTLGRFSEGLSYLQGILEADTGDHVQERAFALSYASSLASAAGQHRLSLNLQQEALATYRELDDQAGMCQILRFIGNTYDALGQPEPCLAHTYESLAICQKIGDSRGAASCSVLIGSALSHLGDTRSANQWVTSGLEYFTKTGEPRGISWALNRLGNIFLDNGPEKDAIQYYEKALEIDLELDSYLAGYTYDNLATTHLAMGEHDEARDFARRGLEVASVHDDEQCRIGLCRTLGNIELKAGNYDLAIQHSQECLRLFKPGNITLDTYIAIGTCAAALINLGRPAEAAVLLSTLNACQSVLEITTPKVDTDRLNAFREQAQACLEPTDFCKAWEEGSRLDIGEATKRALICHLPPIPVTLKE